MKKVISFCLWGDNPKYTQGAIRNSELAKIIYPDWTVRFYCGQSVRMSIIDQLASCRGEVFTKETYGPLHSPYMKCDRTVIFHSESDQVEVYNIPYAGDWRMMLDRFKAITDSDVEVMISRDCDSRLSLREKAAVDEWLASSAILHTMHDHPYHTVPILGGMWGLKKHAMVDSLCESINAWSFYHDARWQVDQDFLARHIWPVFKNSTLNHDEFYRHIWGGVPFPKPRQGLEFVGQVFDENEITVAEHLTALAKAL